MLTAKLCGLTCLVRLPANSSGSSSERFSAFSSLSMMVLVSLYVVLRPLAASVSTTWIESQLPLMSPASSVFLSRITPARSASMSHR